MNVLVINVGSTTLKFACLDTDSGERLREGTVDRIGQPDGDAEDHLQAAQAVMDQLDDLPIDAIGHRVVQGGDRFSAPTRVDDQVLEQLRPLDKIAPLHNPPARRVLEALVKRKSSLPHVLVFDTAYFTSLPAKAHRYAIADSAYRKFGIRRYGAHGTSHQYVTEQALRYLSQSRFGSHDQTRLVSLHLGGGASATASVGGVAVETSMGLTPLEGLVMTSRCGDLDPAIPLLLIRQGGMSADQVDHLLNEESGLVGLCGKGDMREILKRHDQGDEAASLAIDIYVHRLLKYIGGYAAILGGLDALVFTAGVGEHARPIRRRVTESLGYLGIAIDETLNSEAKVDEEVIDLSSKEATAATLVVPTDEELAIARQTASLLAGHRPAR